MTLKSFSVLHQKSFTIGGTKGSEITLRYVTPLGRLDSSYVFMQSGKFVGTLVAVSPLDSSIKPADLERLYRTYAKRIEAEAKAVGQTA